MSRTKKRSRITPAAWIAPLCVLVLVLAGGGIVGASYTGAFSEPTQTLDPDSYSVPDPTQAPPEPGASPAPTTAPTADQVSAALASISKTGVGRIGISVRDTTGAILADSGASQAMMPASNMKILTALASLNLIGADHQFTTRVVVSDAGIILVGGGDPYLSSTAGETADGSLAQLADLTAEALMQRGQTSVTLGFDTSLFTGPSWHPSWIDSYHLDVSPISALCVNSGVITRGQRTTDCAALAGQAFAQMLLARGITATVVGARSAVGLGEIASVQSQRLGLLVQQMLTSSDNTAAETLFRQIGLASGQPGSFAGGQKAMTDFLTSQGLWGDGMTIDDGSGLSRSDQIVPQVLTSTVVKALTDPMYADLLDGLPVAAVTGTLTERFDDSPEEAGRGVVHAKTGSLIDVRTMSGFILTDSGGLVAVSLMINDTTNVQAAQNWLDSAAAAIAAL